MLLHIELVSRQSLKEEVVCLKVIHSYVTKSRAIWHSEIKFFPSSPLITYPQDNLAGEKEVQLQLAITAVLNKKHMCYSATIAFSVPHQTLYNCVKGNMKVYNQAHECDQNLTHAEEKELVQWITLFTIFGYPLRYQTLQQLTEITREQHVKISNAKVPMKIYDKIGKEWVPCFLR